MKKVLIISAICITLALILIITALIVSKKNTKTDEDLPQYTAPEEMDFTVPDETDEVFPDDKKPAYDLTNKVDLNSPEEIEKRRQENNNRLKTSTDIPSQTWSYTDHNEGLYNDEYVYNKVGMYLDILKSKGIEPFKGAAPVWEEDDSTHVYNSTYSYKGETLYGLQVLVTENDDVYVYYYEE